MGGTARYEALERFVEKHGEGLTRKYEELLIGKVVEEFLGTVVNYHVKGYVRLSNDEIYETHYRWSSEEEDYEKKELPDCVPMKEYYDEFIVSKTIIKVSVGSQRDDECYIFAFVDEENYLEIPLGFNPEYDDEEEWRGWQDYGEEFREEAIKLFFEVGPTKASDQLGIPLTTLYTWRNKRIKHGELAFEGSGHKRIDPQTAQVKALEKKIKVLESENDILKKALGFFAESHKK